MKTPVGMTKSFNWELALALFGALHPHDAGGEEDAGHGERQNSVRFVAIVDGYSSFASRLPQRHQFTMRQLFDNPLLWESHLKPTF